MIAHVIVDVLGAVAVVAGAVVLGWKHRRPAVEDAAASALDVQPADLFAPAQSAEAAGNRRDADWLAEIAADPRSWTYQVARRG